LREKYISKVIHQPLNWCYLVYEDKHLRLRKYQIYGCLYYLSSVSYCLEMRHEIEKTLRDDNNQRLHQTVYRGGRGL